MIQHPLRIALGLGLLGTLVSGLVVATSAGPDAPPSRPPARAPVWKGTGSCATFACHGGHGPEGEVRGAYTTWKGRDPHSRAFTVLAGEPSIAIEAALAAATDRAPMAAETDARCLRCHVHPDVESEPLASPSLRALGVSCEGCHGPAGDWLAPHSFPEWKTRTDAARGALGLRPLRNLIVQAELCAGCHVGGPGRDVDHDLIAAGHPRLNFELHAYLDALPKHWSTAAEKGQRPEYEALAWSIGQVVSARASLEQLAARARAAQATTRPWPEFAEYACTSCHHDLAEPPRTGGPRAGAEALGSPPWGTWYLANFPPLARRFPGTKPDDFEASCQALRRTMAEPSPVPEEAERLAAELAGQLGAWLGRDLRAARLDRRAVSRLLDSCLEGGEAPDATGRDRAAQRALAAFALVAALKDLGRPEDPESDAALGAMLRAIEGPTDDTAGPERFRSAVGRLRSRLER